MNIDSDNHVVQLCAAGISKEAEDKEAAALLYAQAWGEAADSAERYVAAHYMARVQDTTADKLHWDILALDNALATEGDEMKGALPSLYLNIAKCYEDMQERYEARRHYLLAYNALQYLNDDGYGKMIKGGVLQGVERTGGMYRDGLESARLITRFLTEDDTAAWREFFEDEEAIALFPAGVVIPGADNAATWVQRQMQRYVTGNYGLQAVISKDTHELVGLCGLLSQEVNGRHELEVGYHMLKRHWGKGYAPEAAQLFVNYAFSAGFTSSLISIIDIRNTNSQRVAEKNGFIRDAQVVWRNGDFYIYRLHKALP